MIDLTGTWVTSFAGFVHDDPPDPEPAPQLAAYYRQTSLWSWLFGDNYDRTAGYFPAATMRWLKFGAPNAAGEGTLKGKVRINRGGRNLKSNDKVTGAYTVSEDLEFGTTEGDFHTIYAPPMPDPAKPDIRLDYQFVATSPDELAWIWWTSSFQPRGTPFRSSVACGTFRRVVAR